MIPLLFAHAGAQFLRDSQQQLMHRDASRIAGVRGDACEREESMLNGNAVRDSESAREVSSPLDTEVWRGRRQVGTTGLVLTSRCSVERGCGAAGAMAELPVAQPDEEVSTLTDSFGLVTDAFMTGKISIVIVKAHTVTKRGFFPPPDPQ